jgi:hypothetical protein
MRRLLIITLALLVVLPLALQAPAPAAAQSGNTWVASYFNNPNWSGNPVLTQWVPLVSFNWGYGSPGAGIPADNFTARFDTTAFFYAGAYTFTTQADDEVALIIDGVTVIDTRNAGQSGRTQTATWNMWQGNHQVTVFYREFTQMAFVNVTWVFQKPGGGGTPPPPPPPPPPSNNCAPTSDSSVQTQFGDYTPCIQQNIHQVNCFVSDGQWNSPNRGSIETEPQITLWRVCTPDSWANFPVSCDPNVPLQSNKCSKTAAGFFPG